MNQNKSNQTNQNYNFVLGLTKILQPVFNILFYISVFFIVLSLILSVILFFVNVDVDQMALLPFMSKITDANNNISSYEVSFGNGIKIDTKTAALDLKDIKAVIYAGLFVLVCTFLTIAPVFKFLSLMLKNINSKDPEKILDEKNPRYVMFIGLCVFLGTVLIRFMARFYNYYLAVRFIKEAPQEIKLSLGVDFLDGIAGLAILFIGLVFAYVFQYVRNMRNNQIIYKNNEKFEE